MVNSPINIIITQPTIDVLKGFCNRLRTSPLIILLTLTNTSTLEL